MMKYIQIIWSWAFLIIVTVSGALCAPEGGIFIPRNGGCEGFME